MANLGIIGLGLMGGSLGLAVRKHVPDTLIKGYDIQKQHLDYCLNNNIIDKELTPENAGDLDLLFIAVPVKSIVSALETFVGNINEERTIITDMGSTKKYICQEVKEHYPELNFIGGHPLSGREVSGPDGAVADLFQGKKYILIDEKRDSDNLKQLSRFLEKLGAEIYYLDPQIHDQILAFTSHLPQLLATNLVREQNVLESRHNYNLSEFTGGGFSDMTRIAASDPDMWADIFLTNSDNIIEVMEEYITLLNNFKKALINHDQKNIRDIMSKTKGSMKNEDED